MTILEQACRTTSKIAHRTQALVLGAIVIASIAAPLVGTRAAAGFASSPTYMAGIIRPYPDCTGGGIPC